MNENSSIILLRNFTCGAAWTPPFYSLDENGWAWKGVKVPKSKTHISGYGSTVISFSNGRLIKILLAVYARNGTWMIFDGEQELSVAGARAKRSLGNFYRTFLTLQTPKANKTLNYFRPWLRHWFEEGWTLDDIDIANLICHCINDKDVIPKLERALESTNLDFRV